jgi:hypothetical protein
MRIIPGLTTTKPERIPAFIADMRRLGIGTIALFPTCLNATARRQLYTDLETIAGLKIPHVHVRADCDESELDYLSKRFGTEVFNIHPAASSHPYATIPQRYRSRFFVENVEQTPDVTELIGLGGICPDYSHWANARIFGREVYDGTMCLLAAQYTIGCCHLSALRPGDPNPWHGEWDHHEFNTLRDFDYLADYAAFMPDDWASLELENSLEEQLIAGAYLKTVLQVRAVDVSLEWRTDFNP